MPNFIQGAVPYLAAIAIVLVAGFVREVVLSPIMGDRAPLGVFTFAILAAAWLGGFWPGMIATAISIGVGLMVTPLAGTPPNLIIIGTFALNGILISAVCESLRHSRRRADQARVEIEAEKEQRAAVEERQRAILNAIPHLVWTADARGKVDYVNQRWNEMLGVSMEETWSGGWKDNVYPDDVETLNERWEAALQSSSALVCECRTKMKDGSYRWHLVHAQPSRNAEGVVTGWFGTATDINDTHQAVEELKGSEARFRNLADAMPVLVWMADETTKCTWFNRAWLDFSGRKMEQEIGDGWAEGVHPDDYDRCLKVYTENFEVRRPFEMDYRLRRRDGVYRWMMDRGMPIFGAEDAFMGFMGSCVDITERKEAEDQSEVQLRAEQNARMEAERTAVLKDEFLATVSHEMRTPLTAMLGWVQLLRNGSLPAETVPQALETIERNARAQAKLIDDLLDMSRILSGRLRLDVQNVNIYETVEAALSAAEPGAAAKKIKLVRVLDSRAGPVSGDPTRLQQVIWNLLNNAIKFTPASGSVTVTLERVNSHLEISVADTGEGITPEFLPHVFDRFRQQDASTIRKHQGLGLGLSIVKQLVELHGGHVRAKSPGLGQGSTFVVALPIAAHAQGREPDEEQPRQAEREMVEEPVPTLLGTRVLVVDDDADTRELLRSILAHSGASVRTAGSAREALDQVIERTPDVLVSDIGMPGEDGYDLIRQVRSRGREQGGQVPALALTAFARSDDRRRAISAGFHMHMSKPVEPAELVTMVASLAKR